MKILWSLEPEPLEAAGGIVTALPLLPEGSALIVSGDQSPMQVTSAMSSHATCGVVAIDRWIRSVRWVSVWRIMTPPRSDSVHGHVQDLLGRREAFLEREAVYVTDMVAEPAVEGFV